MEACNVAVVAQVWFAHAAVVVVVAAAAAAAAAVGVEVGVFGGN